MSLPSPSIWSSVPKTVLGGFCVFLCILTLLFKNIQYKILDDHDNILKLAKAIFLKN